MTDTNPRKLAPVIFANLGTPADGTIVYCSDCTQANPTAGGGGTKAVVEVHYYPKDYLYQSFDCGTGACSSIPVSNHILPAWYRIVKTDNNGNVKARSDIIPVLNQ